MTETSEPILEPQLPAVVENMADEPTPMLDEAAWRQAWAQRVRQETRLPGGFRERLAAAIETSSEVTSAEAEPSLRLSQVSGVFAAALPAMLAGQPRVAEHPAGERFFQGDKFSSEEAAQLARAQLERSGFARETD